MKNLIAYSFFVILVACNPVPTNDLPEDLAGLKQVLKTKKSELKDLENEVSEIEAQIRLKDTTIQSAKRLVSTMVLSKKDFKHFVTIQGNVESDDIVIASSEVGGRLIMMNLEEGQLVKKGQLIAKLDLESIDKQVAEVQKSLELAQEVYDRQKRLWDQNIGSEIQYLQSKNNKERLEKTLETLDFQKTKSAVYSPISGAIDQVFLKNGELAMPGAPIVQIINTYQLKVVADVPENLLSSVKRGAMVEVFFPALNQYQNLRISLVGRTIDASNRTFEIEMPIRNNSGFLKPNLLAEIKINDFTEEDAIIIPLELVQQEVGGKDYVMIKDKDGDNFITRKRYVTTGQSYEGSIVIREGLEEVEEVITDGARGATDNEPIEIINTTMATNE